jgi:hypothetical protein
MLTPRIPLTSKSIIDESEFNHTWPNTPTAPDQMYVDDTAVAEVVGSPTDPRQRHRISTSRLQQQQGQTDRPVALSRSEEKISNLIQDSRDAYELLFGVAPLLVLSLPWLYIIVFSMAYDHAYTFIYMFHGPGNFVWMLATYVFVLIPLFCQASVPFLMLLLPRKRAEDQDRRRDAGRPIRSMARVAICVLFGFLVLPAFFAPLDVVGIGNFSWSLPIHQFAILAVIYCVHVIVATLWALFAA